MDLSLHQAVDSFPYRHKKFDKRKRSRDEDTLEDLEQANGQRSSPTSHFILNPLFYGAERVSTPFSTDSNCSSDYAGFVSLFAASSTPSTKRRRLLSGGQRAGSPSEDSGISLTPQKQQPTAVQQLPRQLKRSLKPSSLAVQPLAKQQKNEPQHAAAISPTKIMNTALKRRKFNSTNRDINIANAQITTTMKSGIKAALKPTPVGTLELSTVSDVNTTPSRPLPAANATVLSHISEDKLRSICTYHGNMVRQFPKKERSPKDQERRNKNTIACRMSRRIKKLEQIAVEEQCKEFEEQHLATLEKIMRGNALLEQLYQLEKLTGELSNGSSGSVEEPEIDVVSVDDKYSTPVSDEWKYNSGAGEVQKEPMTALTMPTIANAFSIAYLMGNLRRAK